MSTPARITTSTPTTTQEKFQIPCFALTALSSFVMMEIASPGQEAYSNWKNFSRPDA